MGFYFSHYLVLGVDIRTEKKNVRTDDKFLPYIEGHRDIPFNIIDGGEGQDVLLFGKVLCEGDHYVGFGEQSISIDIDNFSHIQQKVAEAYTSLFGISINPSDVKLYACTAVS